MAKMNWKIESADINKYRTRKQSIHLGLCHLLDGFITIFTLGEYRGYHSTDACVAILQNAMEMRRKERNAKTTTSN